MPRTLNGFGTMYYGRTNTRREISVCEYCGYEGTLTSYDTGHFIVGLFIPLIPLGKVHIINECPSCKKHRRLSMKKFQAMKDEGVQAVREELVKTVPDYLVLSQWLESFRIHQDPQPLNRVAHEVIEKCKNSSSVLVTMARLFSYYHDNEQALACALLAYKHKDSDEVKELVAEMLLYNHKPEEAEGYLRHIWENTAIRNYWHIKLLIEGYCINKEYSLAEKVITEVESNHRDDKTQNVIQEIKSYVDEAKENSNRVVSSGINQKSKSYRSERPEKDNRIIWGGALIIGSLILFYFISAIYMGIQKSVCLVNGTAKNYSVKINGKEYKLKAHSKQYIRVREGEISIVSNDLDELRKNQSITIESNFWSRPLEESGKVYIINPDHCAIFYKPYVQYGRNASSKVTYKYKSLGLLHIFDNIDYPFQEFPESIETDSPYDLHVKVGLELLDDFNESSPVVCAYDFLSRDSADLFLWKYAAVAPYDDIATLNAFTTVFPEESFDFLMPYLDLEPIHIEAHRIYQSLSLTYRPEHDLIREYMFKLNKEPESSALNYLVARVSNTKERKSFFENALHYPDVSPFAYHGYADWCYDNGRFDEAEKYARQAVSLHPKSERFKESYRRMLYANKKFSILEDDLVVASRKEPNNLHYHLFLFEALLKQHKDTNADEVVSTFVSNLRKNKLPGTIKYKNRFALHKAIYEKDSSTIVQCLLKDSELSHYAHLLKADLAAFSECFEKDELATYENAFLAYIVAKRNRDPNADEYLSFGLKCLQNYGSHVREVTSLIEKEPSIEDVDAFSIGSEQRAVFYAVLGMKYPKLRDYCFNKAKQYNYKISIEKSILDLIL